jgi:SAM-dependent methyltransferase
MEHTETEAAPAESPLPRLEHHHDHAGHGGHGDHDVDPAQFYTREYWDERYGGEQVWSGNPNPLLVRYAADLAPGTALDVGCGEGADAMWLASRGWTVVGADVSAVGLERAAQAAERAGAQVAERITWQQADVLDGEWAPPERHFDLVSAQFMHLPVAMREALHRRLAAAVRPGGTLLVVGHDPSDLDAGVKRPHLPEMFAGAEEMAAVLNPAQWDVETASPERQATDPDGAVLTIRDAVVRAVRRG